MQAQVEAARLSATAEVLSLRDLQNLWGAFLERLSPPSATSFLCKACGPFPQAIVLDGITLGFRKKDVSPPNPGDQPLSGTRHSDRGSSSAARRLGSSSAPSSPPIQTSSSAGPSS
jgi:hypothetical protein